MPTIPSSPERTPRESHKARQIAESFGTDPERYDRTRPRYPSALIDQIITRIPGRDVLDVGVGTGASARPFQERGCRVLGIEVDPRMAEFARGRGFDVEVARFEDWDPAGRMFDAVIAGMTWHWVDPAAGANKAAGVLRPNGLLALFWNVHQPPADLAHAFAEVYRRVLPDTPFAAAPSDPVNAYSQILDNASVAIAATNAFTECVRLRVDWERSYTTEEWLDQVPTFGGHSTFAPEKLAELLAGIRTAIHSIGGTFAMKYAALALMARRLRESYTPVTVS
jgi:SAM-dependent methyltransferase